MDKQEHDRLCELLTASDFELLNGLTCNCKARATHQHASSTSLPLRKKPRRTRR